LIRSPRRPRKTSSWPLNGSLQGPIQWSAAGFPRPPRWP